MDMEVKQDDIFKLEQGLLLNSIGTENFEKDTYLNGLIKKPWGCEYRIYADNLYDVWRLHLNPNSKTSMHCHPRKDTMLLCLEGNGVTTFLDGHEIKLSQGETIFIKKGVFHSTKAGTQGLSLIEVENPRNKFDLIRFEDSYGREKQKYETFDSDEIFLSDLNSYRNYMLRSVDAKHEFYFVVGKPQDVKKQFEKPFNFIFVVDLNLKYHLLEHIHLVDICDIENSRYQDDQLLFILKK